MASKKQVPRPQDGPHKILKNIRYHNPDHELNDQLVRPEDGAVLTFPHLDDVGYALLIKTGRIAPATATAENEEKGDK